MKKDRKGTNKYNRVLTVIFVVFIFAMCAVNIEEVFLNIRNGNTSVGFHAIKSDMENIDTITHPFININGLYQNIMQRPYIYDVDDSNDTIKTEQGYLVSTNSSYNKSDLEKSADQLRETADYLAEKGIKLVYVQAASKMAFSPHPSVVGQKNYTYEKYEDFISLLKDRDIDVIDSRDMLKEGIGAFYITDHHWKTETCLQIADEVCHHLNKEYDFGINGKYCNKDNYNFETHKRAFLGAEGRRTGRYYAGLDDFSIITPDFETDFDIEIYDKDANETNRNGPFSESILDTSKDTNNYSFDDSAYYTYWGGDYGLVHVENNKVHNGRKILVFKDSFGIPVTAFLANAFESIDIVDIRYYCEKESISDLIDRSEPDAVVYIYGPGYLKSKKMFSIKK